MLFRSQDSNNYVRVLYKYLPFRGYKGGSNTVQIVSYLNVIRIIEYNSAITLIYTNKLLVTISLSITSLYPRLRSRRLNVYPMKTIPFWDKVVYLVFKIIIYLCTKFQLDLFSRSGMNRTTNYPFNYSRNIFSFNYKNMKYEYNLIKIPILYIIF